MHQFVGGVHLAQRYDLDVHHPLEFPSNPVDGPDTPEGVGAEQDVDMRPDGGGAVAQQGQGSRSRACPE